MILSSGCVSGPPERDKKRKVKVSALVISCRCVSACRSGTAPAA